MLPLEVEPSELIEDVKARIAASEWCVPCDQQRLLHQGRQLEDADDLHSSSIRKEAMLHMHLRLRGGTNCECKTPHLR